MPFSTGKRALAISDRSGQQFPYREMRTEWNGSFVHFTEYEAKHPQLDPRHHKADAQGLRNARADVRRGTGVEVQLDLYYWGGQFLTTNQGSMQPGISGDIINYKRSAVASVGNVTIIIS
jgi:hypothetical protein